MNNADVALVDEFKEAAKLDVRELARAHTPEAIRTLVKLMKGPKTPPGVKRQCAVDILAQGWGRPDSRGDGGADKARGLTINILKLSTGVLEQVAAGNEDALQVLEAVDMAEAIVAGEVESGE